MKTIIKELILLDIEDVEEALSSYWGRSVSIAEVECTLTYCIPADTATPSGMYLDFRDGDKFCDSFDLFDEDESYIFTWKDKQLSLNEAWLPVEEIFAFDVSAFKQFNVDTDSSD